MRGRLIYEGGASAALPPHYHLEESIYVTTRPDHTSKSIKSLTYLTLYGISHNRTNAEGNKYTPIAVLILWEYAARLENVHIHEY